MSLTTRLSLASGTMVDGHDPLPPDLEQAGNRLGARSKQSIATPLDDRLIVGNQAGADQFTPGAVARLIDQAEDEIGFAGA